jgi:beta-N-acetylhexosaminidase
MTPLFLGLAGTELSDAERSFFAGLDPAGYILFKRNVADPAQLRALTDSLRTLAGRDPTGELFDRLYDLAPMTAIEAVRHNAQALGLLLGEAGINVDCLPLLDVRQPGAHDIIGDRALGAEPLRVAAMGRAVIDGLRAGGAVGVVKHVPGHGRAMADSHVELPVVDAEAEALETDLAPFIALKDAPMAMTAHVVYRAWDAGQCATLSAKVIGEIIRGRIGFDGLLMSDDLGMHALSGGFDERAAGVLKAGCDIVLHCSGDMAEMEAVAGAVGAIDAKAKARLERAMATVAGVGAGPALAEVIAKRDALLDVLPV